MKMLILFCLFSLQAISQQFEIKNRYECFWNERSKSYIDCVAFQDNSTFTIKSDEHIIEKVGDTKETWFIVSKEQQTKYTTVYLILTGDISESFIIVDTFHGEIKVSDGGNKIVSYNIVSFKTQ